MIDKLSTFEEITQLIPAGSTLALGGMTNYRRPMEFVRQFIINNHNLEEAKNLTLLAFTAGLESDLLIGAGMVRKVRTCYFGLEIFGLAPMFTYYANRGEIEVIEESEASLALGLRASIAGIGFLPARAWLGTDLLKLRPDVQTINDPYTGERLTAFPAIKPDVAVIHALSADEEGNAIIGDNKGVDEELTLAADIVIITAEEIVPQLERADLIAPLIHSVVHAPHGALPTSCHPLYQIDGKTILNYVERVSNPDSFNTYLSETLKF
jgi:acyl CoA:acetate/3-ketoacid CoA transferase alpha subunit